MADKLHKMDECLLAFHCPGCEESHEVSVASPKPGMYPVWGWNGKMDRPTFSPSVLVNRGSANPTVPVCHSHVYLGTIRFLSDSTHKLAGKTVDIPDWVS